MKDSDRAQIQQPFIRPSPGDENSFVCALCGEAAQLSVGFGEVLAVRLWCECGNELIYEVNQWTLPKPCTRS